MIIKMELKINIPDKNDAISVFTKCSQFVSTVTSNIPIVKSFDVRLEKTKEDD